MTQYEIALRAENIKLQEERDLMRAIATRDAFYQHFFKTCNQYKSRLEAFNTLNNIYAQLFGQELFTSYTAFRQYVSRKLK